MNLNELSKRIYENNKEKGFWSMRESIPKQMQSTMAFSDKEVAFVHGAIVDQMIALIQSELSEAVEARRKGRMAGENSSGVGKSTEEAWKDYFEKNIKGCFEDEIADTLIRLLDLAGGLDIDIDFHVKEKLAYNRLRPELHGKNH